jgi:putative membrane protein
VTAQSGHESISGELSARQTGMAFQRTRMSADRTLMAVIRTSLSLIGFGFTIYQIFQKLYDAQVIKRAEAPRNFGVGLVALGITMLVLGIAYQIAFMSELRRQRQQMRIDGLIHAESHFPVSLTLLVAIALLVVGIFAILSMVYHTGPFGGV